MCGIETAEPQVQRAVEDAYAAIPKQHRIAPGVDYDEFYKEVMKRLQEKISAD